MTYSRVARLAVLTYVAAVSCLMIPGRDTSATQPTSAGREIDELITQLGNERFSVREAATRRLMEREDALPALRRALKSRDTEVARRAQDILDSFVLREKARAFARLTELAKHGAADQVIEGFVRRAQWQDEGACWQVLADLADKLAELERKSYKTTDRPAWPPIEAEKLDQYARLLGQRDGPTASPSAQLWKGRVVLRAAEFARPGRATGALLAVSGGVGRVDLIRSVFFFGGESIEIDSARDSVVICDGDFSASDIRNSLIIARGAVRCRVSVVDSRIISCGEVLRKHPEDVFNSKIVERERNPLGFVKFFDPADVGIKVEKGDGGVRVKEAAKGQRFAAAGIMADDLLTALNGEAVKDAEHFRRLLRARLAVEEELVLRVRRADQTTEVRVTGKP